MGNRSLDEFLDDGDDGDDEDGEDREDREDREDHENGENDRVHDDRSPDGATVGDADGGAVRDSDDGDVDDSGEGSTDESGAAADESGPAADEEVDESDAADDEEVIEDVDEPSPARESGRAAGDLSVEPAASTYARDPAGGTCAACGESVERRWESEDGLVCPACKEW